MMLKVSHFLSDMSLSMRKPALSLYANNKDADYPGRSDRHLCC